MSVVGGAIICAIIALFCPKFMSIIASSILGSAMILCSIDFFMHGLNTLDWVRRSPLMWGMVFSTANPFRSFLDHQHQTGSDASALLGRSDPVLLAHYLGAGGTGSELCHCLENRPPTADDAPKATQLQGPIRIAVTGNARGSPAAKVPLLVSGANRPRGHHFTGTFLVLVP